MEGSIVKLISISIKGLYGCYNYDVDFNPDVTLIYGLNGCGKTTILNITEAIITGQIFKLFNYSFKTIELKYAKSSDLNDIKEIKISRDKQGLNIEFNNEKNNISLITLEDSIHPVKTIKEISRIYFNRYDFLVLIRNTFNYVYLPLNRSYVSYEDTDELFMYPRYRFSVEEDTNIGIDNRDGAMTKIEALIYQKHSRANATINRINDSFRNSMLKPQIELNNTYNFNNFLNELKNNNIASLKKTQNAYIKILKEFKIIKMLRSKAP